MKRLNMIIVAVLVTNFSIAQNTFQSTGNAVVDNGNALMVRSNNSIGAKLFGIGGSWESVSAPGFLQLYGSFIYDNGSNLHFANGASVVNIHSGAPETPVQIQLNSGGSSYFLGGNIGLGTPFPASKLHVLSGSSSSNATSQYSGDLIIQGNSGGRSPNNGASLEFVIPANTDGNNPWGQGRIITVAGNGDSYQATGKMILGTRRMFDKGTGSGVTWNYGDDIVIDGIGRVGIGSLSPDAKLAVKGTIHAQEVKVDMIGWADYVLESTYKLPALSNVKNYIEKNKRLPDMPSEGEVTKNGVELGQMNKLLLKKVEELTLYLINEKEDNRKKMALLNKRLSRLTKKIIDLERSAL